MEEQKIRQLFKNNANCYADTEDVVQAMDEECFIQTFKEIMKNELHSQSEKNYEVNLAIPKKMSSESAKTSLANSIYKVAMLHYEYIGEHGNLTDGKKLRGNGHHMAQKIANLAEELWEERLQNI